MSKSRCQHCGSKRIALASAHGKDKCYFYAPHMMREAIEGNMLSIPNLRDGDDLEISFCLDCGQLQGTWPISNLDIQDVILESVYSQKEFTKLVKKKYQHMCSCGKLGTKKPHSCPFKVDIMDDKTQTCYCCADCECDCFGEI